MKKSYFGNVSLQPDSTLSELEGYGKASGMLLAQKYFPRNFPFCDPCLIKTLADWEAVSERYGKSMIHRIDYPLGHSRKNAVLGTTGFAESVPQLIKQVRAQGPDGAILIWRSRREPIPRYQNLGGFNISFSVGREVYIELVGFGFDGSDLTRGAAVHERYIVPWSAWRKYRQSKHKLYSRVFLRQYSRESLHIGLGRTDGEYLTSWTGRYDMLVGQCHYAPKTVRDILPKIYIPLAGDIIEQLLSQIIDRVVARPVTLWRSGLTEFSVQGNIPYRANVGWSIEVWEVFQPCRWNL